MIKKTIVYLIMIILLFTSIGCSKTNDLEVTKQNEKANGIVENQESDKANNIANQLKTTNSNIENNVVSEDNIQKIISDLVDNLKKIKDSKVSREDRLIESEKLHSNLKKLLTEKTSKNLSDEDYSKFFGSDIVSKTKNLELNGKNVKIRIIQYNGNPLLYGTLERIWVYVQWWDEKTDNFQLLVDQGGEMVKDFTVINVNKKDYLLLVGYLTLYKPYPVFASTWELNNNIWQPINIFSDKINSNATWEFSIYDNELIIENINKDVISVDLIKKDIGFEAYSEVDSSAQAKFILSDNQIILQNP